MNGAAKAAVGVLGGALALVVLLALFAGGGAYGPGGMMGGWSGYGWLWMILPAFFWFGLLAVMVWAVVRVFPGGGRSGGPDAEEILRERLARGEIDAGEYERVLGLLRGGGRVPDREPQPR